MLDAGVKLEQSFAIFSLKNLRNEEARTELEEEAGRTGEEFLERSEFNEDHSLLGLFLVLEILV